MENKFKIEEVRKFWDKVANDYDRLNEKVNRVHEQRFTEAVKYLELKNNDRVLNIWSRTGKAVPYLKKLAKINLYNLEVSHQMLKIAQKKYPKERFELTDLERLPFSDNYFDAVLSLETLEHTPRPLQLLKEFQRALKKGKKLVMSLPPRTAEVPLRIYEAFFENHGEGPHRFLPSRRVKKMLSEAGLKLLLHKGTLLIPAGPKGLQALGEKVIEKMQKTPVRELGIRQFYVCQK